MKWWTSSTDAALRVWMPKGPHDMEVWTWGIVDAGVPDDVKRQMYRNFQFMFGVGGVVEQDDGVCAHKLPIAITPGKHANDRMYSFYFVNPSGWLCEIGWGGRPATYQSEYYEKDMYGHKFEAGVGPGMSVK